MKDALARPLGLLLAILETTCPIAAADPPLARNCHLRGHLVLAYEHDQGLCPHYSLRHTIGPSGFTVDLAIVPTEDSHRRALGLAYSRDAEVEVGGYLTTARITPILILESVKELP